VEPTAADDRERAEVRLPRARWRVAFDASAWIVAITVASVLRVDFDLGELHGIGQALIVPIVVACHLVVAASVGLYAGRWRAGSFDELSGLTRTTAGATALLVIADAFSGDPRFVPLTATIGGGVLALVLMAGWRAVARLAAERALRPRGDRVARVLVFGAGEGGAQVVTAMLRDPESEFLPVALLDDDPTRRRLRIMGVPVVGTREDVAHAAAAHDASTLLIAIPRAGRSLVGELTDRSRAAGLAVKVLPSTRELLDDTVRVDDIRDVTPSDLLGRREVQTTIDAVAGYLHGRRVLVTGAGGSIGSELCRQIHRFGPSELLMLDRDESALHAVQLSISGRALLDDDSLVLLDIRDTEAMRELFRARPPDVVFHAAALKHLPLLERFPHEGVRTNVQATLDLLQIARDSGVKRFVNISTDKAADPASVLGYTKRISERLTAEIARDTGRPFLSVRFGNVLGSRGSVLDVFQSQILNGGPITVTHPEVTRFFMTTAEAVELVIQAGEIGEPGEVLVLDMGEPVRIAAVAQRLAELAGPELEIQFTGLRPGEKLDEVLFGRGERDERPSHPLIAQVPVPPLDLGEVSRLFTDAPTTIHERLSELCDLPGPNPATEGGERRAGLAGR
jgi:FlaA1/EpsC-like NDP-sugar epimerase